MLSARKQARIMNLGDIVTNNQMKSITAFIALISEKCPDVGSTIVGKSIVEVLQKNIPLITEFKLGKINDEAFTNRMIDGLASATGIKLSTEEFNTAWNAMNPKYDEFIELLKQIIEYNSHEKKVIFISFTNPKDINHLISELSGKINYRVENGNLVEIEGIELHTSYATRQSKAQLIETTIKRLKSPAPTSLFATSMSSVISGEEARNHELMDILYIRRVNNLDDPILKADLEKINQEVDKSTNKFLVDTVIWMKKEKTLTDVLQNKSETKIRVISANL